VQNLVVIIEPEVIAERLQRGEWIVAVVVCSAIGQ